MIVQNSFYQKRNNRMANKVFDLNGALQLMRVQ
jgi:hypothetical protein